MQLLIDVSCVSLAAELNGITWGARRAACLALVMVGRTRRARCPGLALPTTTSTTSRSACTARSADREANHKEAFPQTAREEQTEYSEALARSADHKANHKEAFPQKHSLRRLEKRIVEVLIVTWTIQHSTHSPANAHSWQPANTFLMRALQTLTARIILLWRPAPKCSANAPPMLP